MDAFKVIREGFSRQELLATTITLSNYHRIQATEDLEDAAEYIYRTLKELKSFDAKILKYPYSASYGNLNPVVGWWVRDAEIRCLKPKEELLHSFRVSRTLVVAHSPGGEVEAEVTYVGLGDRAKYYEGLKVNGKAVLVTGNTYLAYREACRRGATAVLFYKEDAPYNAVPYLSLFLSPEEIKWAKALALSVSRKTVDELRHNLINGDKVVVKARVDAGYTNDAQINVVTAKLGDSPSEIHVFAHYCHAGGMVNDNASSAALLIELCKVLNEAIDRGKLTLPKKHSIRLLWYPEYYGSTAYLTHNKEEIAFGVNLDMVGEKQEITNSTLCYVRPPPSLFHPHEALLYYELRKALSKASYTSPKKLIGIRFDTLTYEVGSDHDIYIAFGIPAVMINQWPDTYYHTDLDTIDKFDPDTSILIGSAVGASMYRASTNEVAKDLIISYIFEYIGSETHWVSDEIRSLRINYIYDKLSKKLTTYFDKINIAENLIPTETPLNKAEDSGKRQKMYTYIGPSGIIDLRTIIKSLSEDELDNILRNKNYVRTIIQGIIPMLLKSSKTIEQLRYEIIGELGVSVESTELERIVETLLKTKLIIEV
ncbi:MAG: DUF4910 domain-containing protein [Sulfolobales archaeon]|nr:DUF4910 domain-containing protein [Sulfolobales archaeon]